MRIRRSLLHVAVLAMAIAVGAHVFMHLQTHPDDVAEPVGVHVDHGAMTTSAPADVPSHTGSDHGHLVAALCMAVLTAATLTTPLRLLAATSPLTAASPVAPRPLTGRPLRAPPISASRVEAGVLLRV